MSGARLIHYGLMLGIYTCIAAFFGWLTYDRGRHRQDWLLFTACVCFTILGWWTSARRKRQK